MSAVELTHSSPSSVFIRLFQNVLFLRVSFASFYEVASFASVLRLRPASIVEKDFSTTFRICSKLESSVQLVANTVANIWREINSACWLHLRHTACEEREILVYSGPFVWNCQMRMIG